MRRLYLVLAAALTLAACSGGGGEGPAAEAPEMLRAVPSDALSVGIFSRCDNAMANMLDSTSVLFKLDYGKLARQKAVIALCDVGSLEPLLILETSKLRHEGGVPVADTIPQAASLARQADSLRLYSEQLAFDKHNVLLVSPSATVMTVVRRHLASESSILDAPNFDGVLEAAGSSDAIIWRNSGAAKLFKLDVCSIPRKQMTGFLKGTTEWTVLCGDKLRTVQPRTERYLCNFLDAAGDGQSKLGSFFPPEPELLIDIPIADRQEWRKLYETMLDARVELEGYEKRIAALRKATGKSPLDWEKENDIQEVVYVATKDWTINMVRTAKAAKGSGKGHSEVQANPRTGFIAALYGEPFSSADSCFIRSGNWIISGPRAVLDTLRPATVKGWPSKAAAVVQVPGHKLIWTKENKTLWQDSNR
jgi:hypothetical protein